MSLKHFEIRSVSDAFMTTNFLLGHSGSETKACSDDEKYRSGLSMHVATILAGATANVS